MFGRAELVNQNSYVDAQQAVFCPYVGVTCTESVCRKNLAMNHNTLVTLMYRKSDSLKKDQVITELQT